MNLAYIYNMHMYIFRYILPFTAGGFLNIALVSVVPELMEVGLTYSFKTQSDVSNSQVIVNCFSQI